MSYDPNIPQATDIISVSQGQIQNNFSSIETFFEVNHSDINSADQGKHKFVTMPEQGAAPTTTADEMALYTKDSAGQPEAFIREESNGTEIQLTKNGGLFLGSMVRAAVVFDLSGTIQGTSYNVSSVTVNTFSDFTVNFTTPLTTAPYYFLQATGFQVSGDVLFGGPASSGSPLDSLNNNYVRVRFKSRSDSNPTVAFGYVMVFEA